MKQKLEDGIEMAKTQKDYDDDAGTLSKWSNSSDKIIGEVNGEIPPVPEENKDDDDDDDSVSEIGNDNDDDDENDV